MGSIISIALMLDNHRKINEELRSHNMQKKYAKSLLGGKHHKYFLLEEVE